MNLLALSTNIKKITIRLVDQIWPTKKQKTLKEYFFEDMSQIHHLNYKIEEKFDLIHFVYSLLFSKTYNRTNLFRIEKKTVLILAFKHGKLQKVKNSFQQRELFQLQKIQLIMKISQLKSTNKFLSTLC